MNHSPTYRVLRRRREARSLFFPPFRTPSECLVGLDGLEPSTSRLSGARSSHLSYRPISHLALGSLHYADSCQSLIATFSFSNFVLRRKPLIEIGGDEGIRTLDPLLAGQVLSQLSYTPILKCKMQNAKCKIGFVSSGLLIES